MRKYLFLQQLFVVLAALLLIGCNPKTTKSGGGDDSQLEAEDAQKRGNAKSYVDNGASGGMGVAYITDPEDGFWFEGVKAASNVTIRYASIHNGKLGIYVNDNRVAEFEFTSTGNWVSAYKKITLAVEIPQGAKLGMFFAEGDKAANIDYLVLE